MSRTLRCSVASHSHTGGARLRADPVASSRGAGDRGAARSEHTIHPIASRARVARAPRGAIAADDPVIDARLRHLGVWRFPVQVPFPVDPVNVYAIEEAHGGIALVDTGYGRVGRSAIAEGLWRLGLGFGDVRRIIVTHAHVDHFSLAQWIVERAEHDVPILAHPADIPTIDGSGPSWGELLPRYEILFKRHGLPHGAFLDFAYGWKATYGGRAVRVQPLRDGEVLRFRRIATAVLHLPGHTPGLVCLFDRANGLFWSNDHLLERVTPALPFDARPEAEQAFRPLVAYLESIRVTRALAVRTVLPGHGAPFHGYREAIERVLRVHGDRQARIHELLGGEPRTAYLLAQMLFPRVPRGRVVLAASNVVATLELLESRGEVVREEDAGTWWYRRRAR